MSNKPEREWMTQPFTAHTDENGRINFQGFYGKYELLIPVAGQQHKTFEFHLSVDKENREKLTL